MNGMVFFAQYLAGGRISVLVSLAFFGCSLTMLILSFIKGTIKSTSIDWLLFALALIAMVAWIVTKNNNLAIWLTLIIDVIAVTMIIFKVRKHPGSEDPSPWITGTLAYVFSCITLFKVPFGILYVRPIYGLLCDAILVGAIYFFRYQNKTKKKSR
jgi:uncharacterized membrane protein YoaK (UPF0700 family)